MASESKTINIAGLQKLQVAKALWHYSKPAQFFTLNGIPAPKWDDKKASDQISKIEFIDYLLGRRIKSNIFGDEFNPSKYDEESTKKAKEIIQELRQTDGVFTIQEKKKSEEQKCFFCHSCDGTNVLFGRVACRSCVRMFGEDEAMKQAFGVKYGGNIA